MSAHNGIIITTLQFGVGQEKVCVVALVDGEAVFCVQNTLQGKYRESSADQICTSIDCGAVTFIAI